MTNDLEDMNRQATQQALRLCAAHTIDDRGTVCQLRDDVLPRF